MGAMPIPSPPRAGDPASTLTALFRQVHQQLRDELDGLDDDAINWVPTPGANSIAIIVTHLVGSERETLRCCAGARSERDRDAEFVGRPLTVREVFLFLDGADDLLTELEPQLDASWLMAEFPLPTFPAEERRPGLTWLVGNYGHAREHVGQIQVTKQLYQSERPSPQP
jgi:DinB superfamily